MKNSLICITPINQINGLKEKFKKSFKFCYKPDISKNQLISKKNKFDIIFTNPNRSKIYISREIIDSQKNLKIICTASTGTNHIDLEYARKKNIKIISIRNNLDTIKKITSTAELALTLMLCSIRNVKEANEDTKKLNWDYTKFIGRQMSDLTVGVVGYGRLGKIFTKLIKPLVKKIIIHEKNFIINDENSKYQTGINNLLKKSDIISLHIHADNENINFFNKNHFSKMKKDILIINTSRGEIINEQDLLIFLKRNSKMKYATDVLSNEINSIKKNKLLKFSIKSNQVLITPHIGGMTKEAQLKAYNKAYSNLMKSINKKIK